MSFQNLVEAAQKKFPNLKIRYKDKSLIMKLIGKIMFFNKAFMTSYTTTFGSTIYFPSESFIKIRPISSSVVLLHELVHVYDSSKINKLLFLLSYGFPQILTLLAIPLLLVSWKISLFFLLFALPLPAYFRMNYEKRAYLTSLYSLNKLGQKMKFDPGLDLQKEDFIDHFYTSSYYWMWPFKSIKLDLENAIVKIKNNERPFNDRIFDILDELINVM